MLKIVISSIIIILSTYVTCLSVDRDFYNKQLEQDKIKWVEKRIILIEDRYLFRSMPYNVRVEYDELKKFFDEKSIKPESEKLLK